MTSINLGSAHPKSESAARRHASSSIGRGGAFEAVEADVWHMCQIVTVDGSIRPFTKTAAGVEGDSSDPNNADAASDVLRALLERCRALRDG
jgi:hypothetical protein